MSTGMVEFMELIKEMHEGIFIYSVRISDDPSADQKAGWVSRSVSPSSLRRYPG